MLSMVRKRFYVLVEIFGYIKDVHELPWLNTKILETIRRNLGIAELLKPTCFLFYDLILLRLGFLRVVFLGGRGVGQFDSLLYFKKNLFNINITIHLLSNLFKVCWKNRLNCPCCKVIIHKKCTGLKQSELLFNKVSKDTA